MTPIPPGQLLQLLCNPVRKPLFDRFGGHTRNNSVGRDILADDCTGGDNRARADCQTGQDDHAVPDPDIMPDGHRMASPPVEESLVVSGIIEIVGGAIGEMGLCGTLHRMVAGIDANLCGNRTKFADCRINDISVIHDVGIIIEHGLRDLRAGADFRIAPQL